MMGGNAGVALNNERIRKASFLSLSFSFASATSYFLPRLGKKGSVTCASCEQRFLICSKMIVVNRWDEKAGLFGNGDDDPLFLQVKEAIVPAHASYVPPLPEAVAHQGMRVVVGQWALQASTDLITRLDLN